MDYKHGVVEMQRHSLVPVVSPLVAQLIMLIGKRHKIYPVHLNASFLSLHMYVIFSTLINVHVQTVCTRPSPPPVLKDLGTRQIPKQARRPL